MFPAKPGLLISVSTPSNESVSADLETTGQGEMCVCFKRVKSSVSFGKNHPIPAKYAENTIRNLVG